MCCQQCVLPFITADVTTIRLDVSSAESLKENNESFSGKLNMLDPFQSGMVANFLVRNNASLQT